MVYKRKTGITRKKVTGDGIFDIKSEHDLQKWCVAKLTSHNMLCFNTDVFNGISFIRDIAGKAIYKKHMIAMGARTGQPDLIVLHDQKCTFVEFKFKKGKKSPDQEAMCNLLASLGYEVLEWRTPEQCTDWIVQQLKERENQ